ncbi:hypothetical protein [Thermoactinomyces mirandus]|nr:hypothetical protein [Thermoactinomyces mirandus]
MHQKVFFFISPVIYAALHLQKSMIALQAMPPSPDRKIASCCL